ncbi:hypothetical protein DM02DRAFT_676540 [Periconia macrospinosa]|uniref:AB hydrolase-1 domain-containing protein n=1 Tax=Periconia macrospinosa TaxID=97972 RepID=A0A2V1D776_9PLEO|nr:hypothetical protein DM02DRAFT_676540 [Periconia macrospinosa]
MLVGKSTVEYVFVRGMIYFFSYLGLLCLGYFYLAVAIGGKTWISHPFSIAIETIGAIEILFYFFWFLPYRHYLHKQKPLFPAPLSREERKKLFHKSLGTRSDIDLFIKKWMGEGNVEDVRRENLKEWLLWAVFDREGQPGEDDEELEEYVTEVENFLGREIRPGWGPVESIRLNFQPFTISHRSLVFYLVIGTVDFITSITLIFMGFTFYRQPRSKFLRTFPFRPLTLFAPKESASPNMSYFYRPHTSTKHRPIVFVHGVGIGLAVYIPLFFILPKEIGVLAIEALPVAARITDASQISTDLMREAGDIITQQNLTDFVFIGHSYGTLFAKLFLDSPHLSSRMSRIILLDPVAVLLHLPDVAYNFTRKVPVHANELEIWWGAETDPDIAFTFARRLCWRCHALWREDLLRYPTTLIVGEKDCLVNAGAIASYVTKNGPEGDIEMEELRWDWRDLEVWKGSFGRWVGEGLELVWFEGYDHGQAVLGKKKLDEIMHVIKTYCTIGEVKVVDSASVDGTGVPESGTAAPYPSMAPTEESR